MTEVVSFEESLFYGLGTVAITIIVIVTAVIFMVKKSSK